MPQLIETLSKLSQDEAVIVFVSLDEDEKRFEASLEKHGIPFHNVCDKAGWGGPLAGAMKKVLFWRPGQSWN